MRSFSDERFPHYTQSNRCSRTRGVAWIRTEVEEKRGAREREVFGAVKTGVRDRANFRVVERILFLFYSPRAARAENSARTSRLFENFPDRQWPKLAQRWARSFARTTVALSEKCCWLRNSRMPVNWELDRRNRNMKVAENILAPFFILWIHGNKTEIHISPLPLYLQKRKK